jgi:hypothetical protein
MKNRLATLFAVLTLSVALPVAAGASPSVDIPFEEFTLDNGSG